MMGLPELKHDYSHAFVSGIVMGPRREVTLTIQLVIWQDGRGHMSGDVQLRCGGIVNMEDVTEFSERCPTLEVAWIRYSTSQKSKTSSLFLEIMSERGDDILVIHCSHITVSEVAP